MKHPLPEEKVIIGWREYVDFPDWNIHGMKAKVDTGARTSSLHVDDVKLLQDDMIEFHVIVSDEKPFRRKKVVTRILRKGKVRSSTGDRTHRWYVRTNIRVGRFEHVITLNLTDRGGMNFRMLLGRTAIEDNFLVDVDRSYLLGKKNKRGPKR